ncbi:NitT/TauT family transport system substrate-binding protein [Marinomonas polaris DSM 16579]|uniref:NitT/TauT family transport system substrate-binding protein n=1 Tax=Marinomonas polaris DSM 16579 TaxID=1122206 RepID=A0A1M5G200_9GAMM|nr:ABC transporter substrate-binding protein [Marinomonas polaris]SHF97795.1 NitT/TauT family transport system substrate-binding protein [Marinomonas polaris DSM 16579]
MKAAKKTAIRLTLLASLISSTSVMAADQVTFQLDWLPGGDKAPVYVGIQQGFFADEDLEVKIASGRGSTDALTKMATGQSDIGSSDIGALMAAKAQADVPVVAVFPYFTQAPHAFFVLKSSGIKSIKDLKGKKVATSPFTSSNAFLPLVLKQNGLSESDIKLVKSDPGALAPMMITGSTDTIIAWVTNTALYDAQAKGAGKELIEMPWSNSGLSLYSSSVLASERFLEERPDVAKRFIKAFAKSIEFTYANPDQAGIDLHKMVPEVDASIVSAQIKSIYSLVYNDVTTKDGFGNFTDERIQKTWEYVAEANGLKMDAIDPKTAVNSSFKPE